MNVRRVVTGHDKDGKAIVIFDGDTPSVIKPEGRPGVEFHTIWRIESAPAMVFGPEETTDCKIGLLPPANGSVFRIIQFPPEAGWIEKMDTETTSQAWASVGAEQVGDTSTTAPHPLMHRTETVDYAVCLAGEIYLVLDNSEVLIKAGDAVVQRGTNHAWSNRSDQPCRMMFVLVDGTFKNTEEN